MHSFPPVSYYPGLFLAPSGTPSPPPPPLTLLDNLLGQWPFSETSAIDSATDLSPHNEYLIAVGDPQVDEGQEFRILNGSTQYFKDKGTQYDPIDPTPLVAQADKSYCISMWVRFNDLEVYNTLLANQNSSNGVTQVKLFYSSDLGNIRFQFYADEVKSVDAAETLYTNTLYHILAWYDKPNGKIKIKLNNATIYENTQSGNPYSGANVLIAGAELYPFLANPFNGQFHDLAIWSDLVPSSDVQTALYNSGVPLPFSEYGNINV